MVIGLEQGGVPLPQRDIGLNDNVGHMAVDWSFGDLVTESFVQGLANIFSIQIALYRPNRHLGDPIHKHILNHYYQMIQIQTQQTKLPCY